MFTNMASPRVYGALILVLVVSSLVPVFSVAQLPASLALHSTGKSSQVIATSQGMLLTTYLPEQYAAMAPGELGENTVGAIEIKSSTGTVLMTLLPDQMITLQAIMVGKIHNQRFLANFVMEDAGNTAGVQMHSALVRQLLALHLNRKNERNATMDQFRLEFGKYLVTQQKDRRISVADTALMPCGAGLESNSVYSWKLPSSVESLLNGNTSIGGLNDLVVEVLAGNREISKTQAEDLAVAVRVVNEAFENGRYFLGWSDQFITCSNSWVLRWKLGDAVAELPVNSAAFSTELTINNDGDKQELQVVARENTKVLVELYSEKGSRLNKFYHGAMAEGETRRFAFKRPSKSGTLIYKVTSNGRTYSGLIP